MNILQLSLLLAIPLKCVIASNGVVAPDVIEALEEPGFVSVKRDFWEKWEDRDDLFDEVVTKDVDFIAGFFNQIKGAKKPTLAALFIKRPNVVDQVLKRIKYDDSDLCYLTNYRPELAESHEGFFKAIDKIKEPCNQESAVRVSVINLFSDEKHDSAIPLIDALEKRQFKSRNVKDAAIQTVFIEGAVRGINYFVEKFHEHPAITSERYANGLRESWKHDKSNLVFPFLVSQADQNDLKEVKTWNIYKEDQAFKKAIDAAENTLSKASYKLPRHARPADRVERARLAKGAFTEHESIGLLAQEKGPGEIILSYID